MPHGLSSTTLPSDCRELFECWLVPRYVLHALHCRLSVEDVKGLFFAAIQQVSYNEAIKLAGAQNLIETKGRTIVHSVLHLHAAENYKTVTLQFASPAALDLVARGSSDRVLQRDRAAAGRKHRGLLCCHSCKFSNPYCHGTLVAGGKYKIRNLADSTETEEHLPHQTQ